MKDTLRATLVKNQDDAGTFDRLFELYFSMRPVSEKPQAKLKLPDHDHGPPPARLELGEEAEDESPEDVEHSHDTDESTEMRKFFDGDRMRQSNDIHWDAERMRLSMFSQELILNRKPGAMESALQRLTYHMRLRRSRNDVPFSNTDPFRFCPADGTALGDPRPSGGVTCPECGRSWYRNSAPAVGVAIVRDGKALITVRAREPEKGRVDVPGGFVEAGEHPVSGLVREELGVEIEVEGNPVLLATHTYGPDGNWVLAISFLARLMDGEPSPADDVAEIRWVAAEEVDEQHDRRLVRAALSDGG